MIALYRAPFHPIAAHAESPRFDIASGGRATIGYIQSTTHLALDCRRLISAALTERGRWHRPCGTDRVAPTVCHWLSTANSSAAPTDSVRLKKVPTVYFVLCVHL